MPPRAPLGVLCAGECHAGASPQPADDDRCNFGYARGICPRFPEDALADAVRFAITARDEDVIQLVYVLERNHAPVEHGPLIFQAIQQGLTGAEGRPLLAAQARMFLQPTG